MRNKIHPNIEYKYGFHDTRTPVYQTKPGLTSDTVEEISSIKNEPEWMKKFRLDALKVFEQKPMPGWGADLSSIDFDKIIYYIKPWDKKARDWDEVPADIKRTFDRIGVPESEKKFFAGAAAQYDSDVIYHALQKNLERKGVIFTDMDTGLREHPDIVKKYLGTVIPVGDNKFAALNSACWSGGSFIYVPPGIKVEMPLQAYFRINAQNMGQFERTLIIADEGSEVHYLEGCFTKGALITTNPSYKPIEDVKVGDWALTHTGQYQKVYHTQVRPYTGDIYTIKVYGDPSLTMEATEEHPFLYVKRQLPNERNCIWKAVWGTPKELSRMDYLVMPINRVIKSVHSYSLDVSFYRNKERVKIPSTPEFFRLAGYFLAEGSVNMRGYIHLSFNIEETELVEDAKELFRKVFGVTKFHTMLHRQNHGVSLIVSSVRLARVFQEFFGDSARNRRIPHWMMVETREKQKQLVLGHFRGDGNYYNQKNKYGQKEIFRLSTISPILARQLRDILLRLNIVSCINCRDRSHENRQAMYNVCIGGEFTAKFGELVGRAIVTTMNGKKRATLFAIDKRYAYIPIKEISKRFIKNTPVYNFSVENDESYVANSVAVHNCTAPVYSTDSLHAAVVEIIAKPYSHVRYTTVQNWSRNVYNLVTKRARAEEGAFVEWIDCNLGSKITMKFPCVLLMGRGARADTLSVALAGPGQHQDAGTKMIHIAPDTISNVVSKSVSFGGGRTSYRGLSRVVRGAERARLSVRCDALLLDPESRSDTYPSLKIDEEDVRMEHEAKVSKIGEKELFYLRSRGMSELEAASLIVTGFFEPLIKELPVDYAVEMNRLIQLEMEGSVG